MLTGFIGTITFLVKGFRYLFSQRKFGKKSYLHRLFYKFYCSNRAAVSTDKKGVINIPEDHNSGDNSPIFYESEIRASLFAVIH